MMNRLKILILVIVSLLVIGCGGKSDNVSVQEKFPQFQTTDLNGVEVTENIFTQKKITVMNIWGTFCPPCIAEMPELGEWSRNISPDAQIIGVVCDLNIDDTATLETAKQIINDSNADFVNLIPSGGIMNYLQNVQAVPTTIFIDSSGNLIGEPIIGADVGSYKQRVKEFLGE